MGNVTMFCIFYIMYSMSEGRSVLQKHAIGDGLS